MSVRNLDHVRGDVSPHDAIASDTTERIDEDEGSESNEGSATSLRVFRRFVHRRADGTYDASQITSKECFQAWIKSRPSGSLTTELDTEQTLKFFRRALTAHVTGSDGRLPLAQPEEQAVLKVLRELDVWHCFAECGFNNGKKGFRARGFHEKRLAGDVPLVKPKKMAKKIPETRATSQMVSSEANTNTNPMKRPTHQPTVGASSSKRLSLSALGGGMENAAGRSMNATQRECTPTFDLQSSYFSMQEPYGGVSHTGNTPALPESFAGNHREEFFSYPQQHDMAGIGRVFPTGFVGGTSVVLPQQLHFGNSPNILSPRQINMPHMMTSNSYSGSGTSSCENMGAFSSSLVHLNGQPIPTGHSTMSTMPGSNHTLTGISQMPLQSESNRITSYDALRNSMVTPLGYAANGQTQAPFNMLGGPGSSTLQTQTFSPFQVMGSQENAGSNPHILPGASVESDPHFSAEERLKKEQDAIGRQMADMVQKRITEASSLQSSGSSLIIFLNFQRAGVDAIVQWALGVADSYMNRFGSDWWAHMHTISRMAVMAMGFTPRATIEDARRIVEEETRKYPDQYCIVVDHMASNWEDKYMYQNDMSIKFFGGMSRVHGGFKGKRWHPDDFYEMGKAMATAYCNKGKEARIVWRVLSLGNQYVWYETFYWVHSLGVLIERGRRVEVKDTIS